jgi:hypothetical protein
LLFAIFIILFLFVYFFIFSCAHRYAGCQVRRLGVLDSQRLFAVLYIALVDKELRLVKVNIGRVNKEIFGKLQPAQ